ncbi:MAG: tyrosine-type recombinase/integrase [Myxococcota bacterium]
MTKRRGTVRPYHRDPTRWLWRVTLDGKEESGVVDSEAEGWAMIQAVVDAYELQLSAPSEKRLLTLGVFGEAWLDEREIARTHRGIHQSRNLWKNHLAAEPLADMPLRAITRQHIHKHLALLLRRNATRSDGRGGRVLLDRKLSHQTVKHALNLLRMMLRDAEREGLIRESPAEGVTVPRKPTVVEEVTWRWLTVEEIDAVLAVDHGDQRTTAERRALYATAIYAGLRKSELLRLRWHNVDLEAGVLKVRGELKSRAAFRDVPLLPPALEALIEWRAESKLKASLEAKLRGVTRMPDYVWPGSDGGPRKTQHVWWSDRHQTGRPPSPGTRTKAGIRPELRFHDLRHTFCSHLVQGTWGPPMDLHRVMQLAGHSEIGVTQRYAKLSPHGVAADMARMRERWGESETERGRNAGTDSREDSQ